MLLSNLAKSDSFARLLDLKRPSVRTLSSTATNAFDQLLDLFNKGVSGSYNPTSKFEYLPYLFADLAKFPPISTHLISPSDPKDLPLLTTFTPHTSPPTLPLPLRLGSTAVIRNALLSVPAPLDNIPSLIPHLISPLLLPLIGSDPAFSEPETDLLPPELQLLGPEHVPETDLQVLNNIVESLFLICARGGEGARKSVRDLGAYPVVREVHVGIEDEGIRESVERVVQLLMGDEVEKPEDEKIVEIF
ncbi:Protein hgh1 [Xanthoria parietina]